MLQKEIEFDAFLASYAGCDGGNPDADVWVCGIEHGGELEDPETALGQEREPGSWDEAFKRAHPDYTKWAYNQRVAKVYIALRCAANGGDATLQGWREYLASSLYARDGDNFKLNLFPLACRSVADSLWEHAYAGHRFLASKKDYGERCRKVRFPFLAAARRHFRPRVILGTGKGFAEDFVQAFDFGKSSFTEVELSDGATVRRYQLYEDGSSKLIVSPFLGGPNGVTKNSHLVELGALIARLLAK